MMDVESLRYNIFQLLMTTESYSSQPIDQILDLVKKIEEFIITGK